jgi:predicted small lipoprotein YifL
MTRIALIAALLSLAACGADGPPERPGAAPAAQATVSGRIEIGVSGG